MFFIFNFKYLEAYIVVEKKSISDTLTVGYNDMNRLVNR